MGGLPCRYLNTIEDVADEGIGLAEALAEWADAERRGKSRDSAAVDVVQMVSKEGDPEEFGSLGRTFEGMSCNFENGLLMLKSYLEIPNMWSIPTFYPRPYLVFFCFLPANNASSETSLTISPVPNSKEVAHRPALGAAHANHYDPQHFSSSSI